MSQTAKAAVLSGWHVIVALTAASFGVAEIISQGHGPVATAVFGVLTAMAVVTVVVWAMFVKAVHTEEKLGA